MEQSSTIVNKPWVKQEPQPLLLPSSNMHRRVGQHPGLVSAASMVTVRDLPVCSSVSNCRRCATPVEQDACYCGFCGMRLNFSDSLRVGKEYI